MGCPFCNSSRLEVVYEDSDVAFANVDKSIRNFVVELCHGCGLVFQAGAYTEEYDRLIAVAYSGYNCSEVFEFPDRNPRNTDSLECIVQNLPNKPNLNVLEIGSNRGDLLFLLKERVPSANILGIEPTQFESLFVPTINAYFRKELFSSTFDVVIMKHVLEHIKYPWSVIADINGILSEEGILYVEVPDLENSLVNKVEDFIPDHVTYFSLRTLNRLLSGFRMITADTRDFLRVIAGKGSKTNPEPQGDDLGVISQYREWFDGFRRQKRLLKECIRQYVQRGKKIVFYGVSYYYKRLFKELQKDLDIKNCYYCDDSFLEGREATYHIPRLDSFDENCVVIICSNNFKVQEELEQKLLFRNSKVTIIRPWLKVVNAHELTAVGRGWESVDGLGDIARIR